MWDLVVNNGQAIRQALAIAQQRGTPIRRVILVGGSPCQNLTIMNAFNGFLGVAGPASKHVHIFPVLLSDLHLVGEALQVFLCIENAGSMQDFHRQYILEAIGFTDEQVTRLDAQKWSAVRRNRLFISSLPRAQVTAPQQLKPPWDDGWVPSAHKEDPKHMPWLRTRGDAPAGNPRHTAAAYHPISMVYRCQVFGGPDKFQALWTAGKAYPDINWELYIPEDLRQAWQVILDWDILHNFYPNEDQDKAADALADFFTDPLHTLPFRLPNL